MGKFAVLYTFTESTFNMAMHRLTRLSNLNPEITFFPMVGARQLIYIPIVIDQQMFGFKSLPGTYISHLTNWLALSVPGVFRLSVNLNKKIVSLAKNRVITGMCAEIGRKGAPALFVDYTPKGYINLDHSIMSWFNDLGKQVEFDYLIFYESDIFTTNPLDVLYEKYAKLYDACFVDYGIVSRSWGFYDIPIGCRRATTRWLKQRMLPTTLYRGMFAGAMISRRCLERLRKLRIDFSGEPYCHCEMRLPTILTALGFKCGRLDFPFIRYRPEWSWSEIVINEDAGIFHPVKKSVPAEMTITVG
jgi:hypothetical protein